MRSMMLALFFTSASSLYAIEDKEWTFSGFLDTYYQTDTRRPNEPLLFGRQFDIYRDRGSIAVGQINLSYKPINTHAIGLIANLSVGKNAELINFGEPGDRKYEALHQLYATYTFGGKTPVTIDAGKFSTPIGYEVSDSLSNDQYSRSFVYTYAQPIYHAGVRITAPLSKQLTGTLIAAQGWNEIEDSGKNKAIIVALAYTAGKTTVFGNYYLGEDGSKHANENGIYGGFGFGTSTRATVNLADASVVHQFTDKLKLGVNGTYGTAEQTSGVDFPSAKFYGVAFYAKYAINPELSFSVRADSFNDDGGLRTGIDGLNLSSLTAGLDYTYRKNLLLRFEFRRDAANQDVFPDDGAGKSNRSTLTFAVTYKF